MGKKVFVASLSTSVINDLFESRRDYKNRFFYGFGRIQRRKNRIKKLFNE